MRFVKNFVFAIATLFVTAFSCSNVGTTVVAPTINVRDYGATGDGVTDDSTAIRNAIAAVPNPGILYIPAGTYVVNPSSGFFKVQTGMTIKGDGASSILKIPNSAGDYAYIFRPNTLSTEVDNLVLKDFVINQNILGNSLSHPTASLPQTAVWIGNFQHVTIDSVKFILSGSISAIVASAAPSSDIKIRYCTFQWLSSPNGSPPDTSAIYCNCDTQLISFNTFTADFADPSVTAIECHGRGVTIASNTVTGFRRGVNLVTFNAGVSAPRDGDMVVYGNKFTVCTAGISLWSPTSRTLKNVSIHDNIFNLRPELSPDNNIIAIGPVRSGSSLSGDYDGLYIKHNSITYVGCDSPTTLGLLDGHSPSWSTYDAAGIIMSPYGHMTNVVIANNSFQFPLQKGICIGDTIGPSHATDVRMSNFTVQANTFNGVAPLGLTGAVPIGISTRGRVDRISLLSNVISFYGGVGKPYSLNGTTN